VNEDIDEDDSEEDDSDDEEGVAPEHTQCFLALNSISEDKTKVAVLDEMLQYQLKPNEDMEGGRDKDDCVLQEGSAERKDVVEDRDDEVPVITFSRDKVPVRLDEPFLFAKAFPQQVCGSTLCLSPNPSILPIFCSYF